ncbi:hypothetical protein OG890_20705 [Streptomyces anulatus]|uniref:hypothetical protein n=1 Tax=Streptomyces anulatus TaxID=1892 RepID=UPI0022558638|nr:hypothetical protein [Streptomyces anulatus]MCX4486347.1 hypothetical protein [Streptomyces anulatus]WSU78486.1 hypothetical protein OG499_38665 [Streptomyces anulatus]
MQQQSSPSTLNVFVMTAIASPATPDPTTPDPAPAAPPPVFAPWAVLLLAVGMFVLIPITVVVFMLDRPNVRDSMDAAGSFLGGTAGWGSLILSLVLCVLQAYRDRPSP